MSNTSCSYFELFYPVRWRAESHRIGDIDILKQLSNGGEKKERKKKRGKRKRKRGGRKKGRSRIEKEVEEKDQEG